MAHVAWAETYPSGFTGFFSTNPADATKIRVSFQAIFVDTVTKRKEIINDILIEITFGMTLAQIRDAVANGIKAKGAEYGFTITSVLLPSFQLV